MEVQAGNIVSSGSHGNCIIYHEIIAVDVGVPFSMIKPYLKDLKLIVLTHIHFDHFNLKTIKKIAFERPTIRIFCGEWMLPYLTGIKNIDVCEIGKLYDYGEFQICAIKAYHDTPSIGVRIFKDNHKLIHITDTNTLAGITARNYDEYYLESNYSEPIAERMIQQAREKGEFTHIIGSINSHLSEEQCNDFYYNNKSQHSKLIRLHETKSYL